MKKFKKIIIIITIICISIFLTGCDKNTGVELKDKTITELEYLNNKIIGILNSLNNISFENYTITSKKVKTSGESQNTQSQQGGGDSGSSGGGGTQQQEGGSSSSSESGMPQTGEADPKEIRVTEMVQNAVLTTDRKNVDWNLIKSEIESLNESWGVILLDLYSLNVKNNDILDFSTKINNSIVAIKNENKKQSIIEVAGLYSSIPLFLQEIGAEQSLQKIRETQDYIIKAYALADDMTNTDINIHINKAVGTFAEVMSNIDYVKDKRYKINEIYVLLNELLNSLDKQDTDVFYLKYKNVMEVIGTI